MSNQMQSASGSGLTQWTTQESEITKVHDALCGFMEAKPFIRHMMTEFQRNDEISGCSDLSKWTALCTCAAYGLLPTLDQVKLVPYGNEIKAVVQWQGFKAIMERHPDILELQPFLVHKTDDLIMHNGEPLHEYDPFDENRTINGPDDIRGGYIKVLFTNGRAPKYHFVPVSLIIKAQNCAKTQKVWQSWYNEMALKTLFRNCFNRRAVPIDPMAQQHLQKVLADEDEMLGNDPNRPAQEAKRITLEAQLAKQTELMDAEPEPQPEAPQEPPADPETYEDFRALISTAETIHQAKAYEADALNVLTAADERSDIEDDCNYRVKELDGEVVE